jgi:thiamine biosynthesis lipoprotein
VPVRTDVLMGTRVTIEVIAPDTEGAIARAFDWFRAIEDTCTRFDPHSELMQLTARIGEAVPVSTILFEAVQFALRVAEVSGGAFDPTVGHALQRHGFTRHHRNGATVRTPTTAATAASFRDVELDATRRTIRLRRELLLDLGAVAKGLAVDSAARELRPFVDFAIDAGGDLYLGGHAGGRPWSIGIRHPRVDGGVIGTVNVSDQAVCTSGDYERRTADGAGHHIVDPRTGGFAAGAISATVIAPTAMAADALATAAFVLGPADGIALLERTGVHGMIVARDLARTHTSGWPGA